MGNKITAQLGGILPRGWKVRYSPADGSTHFDGYLELLPPSGRPLRFEVELKSRFEPRDIDRTLRLNKELSKSEKALVLAPYLSRRSRELLKAQDISHADLTGTFWLASGSLFIAQAGAEKSPKPGSEDRPRTSLRGPITGRVVRFLCDARAPLKVREIAAGTNVNAGNISRILEFLEREHFVERSERGSVSAVDWESLIGRWAPDLQKERRLEAFLEPRGTEFVTGRLTEWALPYAITGSYASAQLAPVVAPPAIDVYVRDIDEARASLALLPSDRIGNVRLIQAFDRVAFERTIERRDLTLACPSQVAADLLTLPNRSRDEFNALIDWMRRHEPEWRR
jgi:hypothetical protein